MIGEAIIGAMVGDYILQTDYMAVNKKKDSIPCAVHCLIWTVAVLVCSWTFNPWLALWLFATHFAIDRSSFIVWWMTNISGQKGFAEKLAPWSIITVDNVFHLVTILVGFKALPYL